MAELQGISQRFGKLEDQTNQDRIILKGLVNQISNQQNNPTVISASNVSSNSRSVHNLGSQEPGTISISQQIQTNSVTVSHTDASVRPKSHIVQPSITNSTSQSLPQLLNIQHKTQQSSYMKETDGQSNNNIRHVNTGNMCQYPITPVTFTSHVDSNCSVA